MFVYSKLSPHVYKLSTNYGTFTQTISSKNTAIISLRKFSQNGESSNRYNPVSPIFGISCGLLFALFYLRKKEIEDIFFQRQIPLQVVSCLDTVDITEFHNKQRPVNSLAKRDTLSKELKEALERTDQKLLVFKEKHGIPGISVAVSIDGRPIWSKGYGYSDVENLVPCTPSTVMRIASISKPLTASAIALLWQRGKIDLDLPIQTYVPEFPVKKFEEKEVAITTRHILTHMSGIRNYIKADQFDKTSSKPQIAKIMEEKTEWHNKSHFSDTLSSLELFKDDALIHAPTTRYLYSTLAWTLLSAVIENAAKQSYLTFMHSNVFTPYKLYNTQEDKNSPILSHRSKNYERKSNKLTNTPYVDNSYKWAGGGFLSSVLDISRFANTMLGFYQGVYQLSSGRTEELDSSNEYALSQGIVRKMWTCQTKTNEKGVCIGLGWIIKPNLEQLRVRREDEPERISVFHSGGAVGASSYLLILPRGEEAVHVGTRDMPSGIVIAIIGNLENISFSRLISEIGEDLYSVAYE